MKVRKKILAVASGGGHWIQLLRLMPAFQSHDVTFVSTNIGFAKMVPNHQFFAIADSNRRNKTALFYSLFTTLKLVFNLRPQIIITTGAAPGLIAIVIGRCFGAKTLWVDSLANVEEVSMSGRIAKRIAHSVYTQWPNLANKGYEYYGNVISE